MGGKRGKGGKGGKRGGRHTGLKKHAKKGTKLQPPLAALPVSEVAYDRDLLPELLWIAALADEYGLDGFHRRFMALMDAIDTVWPGPGVAWGFVSDFGRVSEDRRAAFKADHAETIQRAFHKPIGRLLAFYPECPAAWLINADELTTEGPLDPERELARLTRLVVELLPGKDAHVGRLRVQPFIRMMKHGTIHFPPDYDFGPFERYPGLATKEEAQKVESMARMMVNMDYQQSERFAGREWPTYFWRHNRDLRTCAPVDLPIRGSKPLAAEQGKEAEVILRANSEAVRTYVDLVGRVAQVDLYDPSRDEILLGLFARCARLFVLLSEDANLWARDTSGIMLRCLAESVIAFTYLLKAGSADDFVRFREYGEGQEKLLMLQLQDEYPDAASLEGRTAQAIGDELGAFRPELIEIELGHWAKKDTRKLAQEAGLERLYRLVFNPSSSDVHGTWPSLTRSNLRYCSQPLHRFHRLPMLGDPLLYLDTMVAALDLIRAAIQCGVEKLGFPPPPVLQELPTAPSDKNPSEEE